MTRKALARSQSLILETTSFSQNQLLRLRIFDQNFKAIAYFYLYKQGRLPKITGGLELIDLYLNKCGFTQQ